MADRIAVMNKGVLQQVGDALDIYDRPATAFVADFIGSSDLLTGTLRLSGRGSSHPSCLAARPYSARCASKAVTATAVRARSRGIAGRGGALVGAPSSCHRRRLRTLRAGHARVSARSSEPCRSGRDVCRGRGRRWALDQVRGASGRDADDGRPGERLQCE